MLLNAGAAPRVTVVVVPGLRAKDCAKLPFIANNTSTLAAGFMVCRAGGHTLTQLRHDGRDRLSSLILTLAAGARTVGPAASAIGSPLPKQTGSPTRLPRRLWRAMKRYANGENYPVHPGLLGDLVHQAGMTTAGLADCRTNAEAALSLLVTADSKGSTDTPPWMLRLSRQSPCSPSGVITDSSQILQTWRSLKPQVGLCAITLWVLYRADTSAPKCLASAAVKHRAAALAQIDHILTGIARVALPRDGTLVLLSPGPDRSSPAMDRLAPVFMTGPGVTAGVISSASTHLPGVVVNTDFLPTILKLLTIRPNARLVGRPFNSDGLPVTITKLVAFHRSLLHRAASQQVFGGLPTLQLVLLLICLAATVTVRSRLAAAAACGVASIPLALLLLPLVPTSSLYWQGAEIGLWLGVWMAAGGLLVDNTPLLIALNAALLSIICTIDLLTGCNLQRHAWMSYSVMEAARFFGIGGEYTGAVLGSAVIIAAVLIRRSPKYLSAALVSIAALTLMMAWPTAGAKVGALPTGICVAGLVLLAFSGRRVKPAHVVTAALTTAALLAILVVIDFHHTVHETQLGRAFQGRAGGTIVQIAYRKLSMSAHLLTHSIWTLVLGTAIVVIWQTSRRLGTEGKALTTVSVLGSLCCLVFNDAGPAIAAAFIVGIAAYLTSRSTAETRRSASETE